MMPVSDHMSVFMKCSAHKVAQYRSLDCDWQRLGIKI